MDRRFCASIRDLLPDYVAHQLAPDERTLVEQHLITCKACRAELREWQALDAMLAEAEAAVPPDVTAAQGLAAIHARLRELPAASSGSSNKLQRASPDSMGKAQMNGHNTADAVDMSQWPAVLDTLDTLTADSTAPRLPTLTRPQSHRRARSWLALASVAAIILLAASLFYFFTPQFRGQKSIGGPMPTTTIQPAATPMPTSGTWHTVSDWPAPASDMVFAQSAPQLGYLCTDPTSVPKTSSQWLYKTTDGGTTWHAVAGITTPNVNTSGGMNCRVFVDANNASDVFAQLTILPTGPGAIGEEPPVSVTLWRSHNGGATWQQLHLPLPLRDWAEIVVVGSRIVGLSTYDGQVAPVCLADSTNQEPPHQIDDLYASDDGGMTWKTIGQSLINQGLSITAGGTDIQHPDIQSIGAALFVQTFCIGQQGSGYVAQQAYWRSTDGGSTWAKMVAPGGIVSGLHFAPSSSGNFYGVAVVDSASSATEPTTLLALYTSDGGATWASLPSLSSLPGLPSNHTYLSVHNIVALPDGSVLAEIIAGSSPNAATSEIYTVHPQDATSKWQRYALSKGWGAWYTGGWDIASTSRGLVLWGWVSAGPSGQLQQPVYLAPLP